MCIRDRTHVHHEEYAKRTLYAYMPCAGLRGTDYIDEVVRDCFENDWREALETFVKDDLQKWCPTWIKRNYEILHQVDLPECTSGASSVLERNQRLQLVFEEPTPTIQEEPVYEDEYPPSDPELARPVDAAAAAVGDDAKKQMDKAVASREPPCEEDHERPEAYDTDYHWNKECRPPEELHSALGPNLNAEARTRTVEPLQDAVNPGTFDWHSAWQDVELSGLAAKWETLKQAQPDVDLPTSAPGDLDDLQQLFVTLV